jgi:DNA-cytosine methyltransferase
MFSGYGGASWGLKMANIPYECIGISEILPNSIKCYNNNFPNIKNYGDITKIDTSTLPDFDLMTGGFPCCHSGVMIKTNKGYKKIVDITTEDFVLTHKNRYNKVVRTMKRISKKIFEMNFIGSDKQLLTENHPLFIKDKGWVKVKDVQIGDYIGMNINKKSENVYHITKTEAHLIGRYLADGLLEKNGRTRIVFCIGRKKREHFEKYLTEYKYFINHKERNCSEYCIASAERLYNFCSQCKSGAKNKEIPEFLINLPKDILLELYNGYFEGDGHTEIKKPFRNAFNTTSKKLYLGLQDICIKLFGRVPTFYKRIDNRKESFSDSYTGTLIKEIKIKTNTQIIDKDYLWVRITKKNEIDWNDYVYNFEVEEDHSYTIDNLIIKNCQDVSMAGQRDITKGRTNLYREIIRISKEKKPKYMLLENVKGLLSMGKKDYMTTTYMQQILYDLRSIGYDVIYKVLNSKHYGIPQNRERIWFVCKLGRWEWNEFSFPFPQPLKITLKDILEKEVDKKYYLSDLQIEKIKMRNRYGDHLFEHEIPKVHNTLCHIGKSDVGIINTQHITPEIKRIGGMYDQSTRWGVYDSTGVAPSLVSAMGEGGGHVPMIMNCLTQAQGRQGSAKGFLDSSIRVSAITGAYRRLTPKECFRLMGFTQDQINIQDIADSHLYAMAGNGWDVSVVSKIFRNLFRDEIKISTADKDLLTQNNLLDFMDRGKTNEPNGTDKSVYEGQGQS